MDVVFEYRGRRVTESDLGQVRALIAAHPQASRRALSFGGGQELIHLRRFR